MYIFLTLRLTITIERAGKFAIQLPITLKHHRNAEVLSCIIVVHQARQDNQRAK